MKRAGDVLKNFFEGLGISDDKNYAGFFHAWREIVGQDLFAHCRAADIKGEILVVAVDHPGWMSRTQFKERDILRAIKKQFPQLGISSIAYTLVDRLPPIKAVFRPDATNQHRNQEAINTEINEQAVDNSVQVVENFFFGAPEGAQALKAALEKLKHAIDTKQKRDKSS